MKKTIYPVALSTLLLLTQQAMAFTWDDLWLRPDQQGEDALEQGNPEQAASLFKSTQWQGAAFYRAGKYQEAVEALSQTDTPLSYYDKGNALAKMGKFQEAIAAYDEALRLEPNHEDAQFNRDLLQKLLQENKQDSEQNQQQQQQSSKDQQQQNSDSEQQSQQNKDSEGENNSNDDNNEQQNNDKDNQPSPNNQDYHSDSPDSKKLQSDDNRDKAPEDKSSEKSQQPQPANPEQTLPSQQQAANPEQVEKQQATEQWLRRIPDDPGGLLRQKFLRDHQRYQTDSQGN